MLYVAVGISGFPADCQEENSPTILPPTILPIQDPTCLAPIITLSVLLMTFFVLSLSLAITIYYLCKPNKEKDDMREKIKNGRM